MNVCIPYSFWIERGCDNIFQNFSMKLYWKIYCPSVEHKYLGMQKTNRKDGFIFSGYPKLDTFYDTEVPPSLKKVAYLEKYGLFMPPV